MNRNTISRQITTTEENIRRLMADLEHSDIKTAELASCQSKVDKLFGKLSDSHSELTSDVKEMLSNLRAGKVNPDEFEKLLVREREKVSFSLQLADNARKNLDDVLSFVQHFVHDVERGKPVPKESFKSLYHELDTIADSMGSMAKVHRSKDIEKLKRIMQAHLEDKINRSADNGVLSLKVILSENNREAKERQQKLASGNNRTSVMGIGSLARPRSSQNLMDSQTLNRLQSPDMNELIPPRIGSPSPLRRTGTAGSMGSLGPTSPIQTKGGFGVDTTNGHTARSNDENETDTLTLHGRPSTILKGKKNEKKKGKKEKRLSSAVIYTHTEDDSNSIGSSGGLSLSGTAPAALSAFVPAEAKKIHVHQSVQTDDVVINYNSNVDLSPVRERQGPATTENTRQGIKSGGGKKSAGGKRKGAQNKDGKAPISMVSARRGSRDSNKAKGGGAVTSYVGVSSSDTAAPQSMSPKTVGFVQNKTADAAATQEYFKNYVDKEKGDESQTDKTVADKLKDVRESQVQEEKKIAAMSAEDAKLFLDKKEQRLILLEAKLEKQQNNIDTVVNAKLAEEVSKISAQITTPSATENVTNSSNNDRTSLSVAKVTVDDEIKGRSTPSPVQETRNQEVPNSPVVSLPQTDEVGLVKKKTDGKVKPPAGRKNSFSKKGAKDRSHNLLIDKIIDRIVNFLPKDDALGGKRSSNIPVHTLSISSSMDDSIEDVKLPPIVDPTANKAVAKPSSKSKRQEPSTDPTALAVAGVRVSKSNENSLMGDEDDNISVLSIGSQESAMQRMSRTPTHPPELVNEIWIPPPGNLNKKIFNTVCIFPLHTMDQGTSTDDLSPSSEIQPLEIPPPEPSKNEIAPVEQTPSVEKSPTSQSSPIIPRCLSNVEAISRPSTRGGENIVISRPISGIAQTTSKPGTARKNTGKGNPSVTLQDVTAELKKGAAKGNPLLQLYLYFYKDLDVQCRHHLLAAASGISMNASKYVKKEGGSTKDSPYSVESLQGMSDMFEVVAEEVSKLEYTSFYAMQALFQIDHTVNDLILIATSREELTDSFYFHLKESSKKLGEVKIAEAWVNMLLHDSRAIFTRTRALGIDPVLIGPQFSIAYQAFLSCQGANLALKKKLDEIHALVQKYLAVPIIHVQNTPVGNNPKLLARCEQLQERCEDLEEAIEDIKEENEELREELHVMDSQLDRTPGALLFFSVLHNPTLPDVVTNHIQTLSGVKNTLDGHEHFDFVSLKRRLETCLHGLPPLQQFLKKYNSLHKKWSVSRAKMFADRRQIGADADNYYVCPICNIDSRKADVDLGCPVVNTAPKSNSTGALMTTKTLKKKGKISGNAALSPMSMQF